MLRFLDRFYRYRLLLLALPATTITVAMAYVAAQPRMYEATARVWVDQSIQGEHPNPYITAAEGANLVLYEYLQTREFCAKVASGNRRLSGAPAAGRGAAVCDDGTYQQLSTRVVLDTAGPNVITVAFRDHDPRTAASTTQTVVDLFKQEVFHFQTERAKATVAFYEKQVKDARTDLARADSGLADSLSATFDPLTAAQNATGGDALSLQSGSSADVVALQRDDESLRRHADQMAEKLSGAQLDLTMAQQSTPTGYRLIDRASAPSRPVSRTKLLLAAGVGGVAGGLLLSLLVLTALTAADSSLRYGGEVASALGLRLVGTIPATP